jgi:hypothetical protein
MARYTPDVQAGLDRVRDMADENRLSPFRHQPHDSTARGVLD